MNTRDKIARAVMGLPQMMTELSRPDAMGAPRSPTMPPGPAQGPSAMPGAGGGVIPGVLSAVAADAMAAESATGYGIGRMFAPAMAAGAGVLLNDGAHAAADFSTPHGANPEAWNSEYSGQIPGSYESPRRENTTANPALAQRAWRAYR